MDGVLTRHGESWAAFPREVVLGVNGIESVIFEVNRKEGLIRPFALQVGLAAVQLERLIITLTICLVILLKGTLSGLPASWGLGGLALMGVIFLQLAMNILNDVEDYIRLIDLPGSSRGSRALKRGWLSAKELKKVGYLAFGMSAFCALPVLFNGSLSLILIAGVAAIGALSYSNPPFEIKYRSFGDLFLFVLVGPLLTMGLSQAVFGQFDMSVLLFGFYFGFASWGISHVSNIYDMDRDRKNKMQTLACDLGFEDSKHFLLALYGCAFATLWIGVALGSLSPFVAVISQTAGFWVIPFIRRVYQASGPASALLVPIRIQAEKILLVMGFWLCMTLSVEWVLHKL